VKKLEKFLVKPKTPFLGFQTNLEEAKFVIVGFPFDSTSTYRFGSKKAPKAIREASLNIETYSFRSNLCVEDLKIHDLGNVKLSKNMDKNFSNLTHIVSEVFKMKKFPVVLGGEHTLTYSVFEAFPEKFGIISFDAHFDLRDEYMGRRFSHTTFMRRIIEKVGKENVFFVGVRATCKEELEYVNSKKIRYLSCREIKEKGLTMVLHEVRDFMESFSKSYLTIDVDVLDPAYAPAVANPEPEGLNLSFLLDLLYGMEWKKIVGFDLVEVAPDYDFGVTSIEAAKIVFEVLGAVEKSS